MKPFVKSIYIFLTLTLLLISCSGDDDGRANQPPEDFNLIGVTNGAIEVGLLPTFSWENAVDPEGEEVTYTLLLDTQESPETIVSENIGSTSFNLVDRLLVVTQYYWRVEAVDSNGNRTSSTTFSFTTRNLDFSDNLIVENAAFTPRDGHTSVVFDDKMWVIGGRDDIERKNDVWFSTDGINWSVATNTAPFSARNSHSTVVFDNKIWVIGGSDRSPPDGDIWFSADGINWSLATDSLPFLGRSGHSSVVFDNKLWVIAGIGPVEGVPGVSESKNDIWFSTDGVTWSLATDAAPFAGSIAHSVIVYDNKIWVIGDSRNNVWSSTDGVNWDLATDAASFSGRSEHSAIVYDNKMWLIGGYDFVVGNYKNDIWFSTDGINWSLATNVAPFDARSRHSTIVYDNKIWVIGGRDSGGGKNDVWAFD